MTLELTNLENWFRFWPYIYGYLCTGPRVLNYPAQTLRVGAQVLITLDRRLCFFKTRDSALRRSWFCVNSEFTAAHKDNSNRLAKVSWALMQAVSVLLRLMPLMYIEAVSESNAISHCALYTPTQIVRRVESSIVREQRKSSRRFLCCVMNDSYLQQTW